MKNPGITYISSDGSLDIAHWLENIAEKYPGVRLSLISQACRFAQLTGGDHLLATGESCLQEGLKIAEILLDLHADSETIAAAILYNNVEFGGLHLDDVNEHLGSVVTKLIAGTRQMEATPALLRSNLHAMKHNRTQIDNLRKMLLAMVEDVRVVLIKLAERTCVIRSASRLPESAQQQLAEEIFSIYAPLANRLGIGQLKWELEDMYLRYKEPAAYKELAHLLDEKRSDREHYIKRVIHTLKENLATLGLKKFEVTGRAKHIYSIYRKMRRKEVGYHKIYDVSAVRVLVQDIDECYLALSAVHQLWEQIPEEFDDYITHPKPNGYRSLHTALIGPEGKNLEVQIRTFAMHQESELGVAAHWKYKEGRQQQTDYEEKIAWLRQVLEWQRDLAEHDTQPNEQHAISRIFDDRVYVFTPAGEIVDLPQGATPLDFAYQVHSEIGHRCRGAKINGAIVPLTYTLRTGERVEILTQRHASPSRDWANPQAGYLTTARARTKVMHWFKQQDTEQYLLDGQNILEQELKRVRYNQHDNPVNYEKVARQLHFKSADDMYLALAHGDARPGQIINVIQSLVEVAQPKAPTEQLLQQEVVKSTPSTPRSDVKISGLSDLLTYHARCCKPIPGDEIIGFITRGRGIAIHRKDCSNINKEVLDSDRLLEVNWDRAPQEKYPVDIVLLTRERQGLARDILSVLTHEKIHLLGIKTVTEKNQDITHVHLTVEAPVEVPTENVTPNIAPTATPGLKPPAPKPITIKTVTPFSFWTTPGATFSTADLAIPPTRSPLLTDDDRPPALTFNPPLIQVTC